jgi:hypothetical protein
MKERLANISKYAQGGRAFLAVSLMVLVGVVACTRSQKGSQPAAQNANSSSSDAAIEVSPSDTDSSSDDPCSEMFSSLFVAADSISYKEYEIARLHKTVYDKETRSDIPASFAVLKSGGKEIMKFEGNASGVGNETNFGFASLLGGDTKQLIVSQTIPRNGRHWVVDLGSEAVVVFDSHDWGLGQEDVCAHDFDDDGIVELSLMIEKFCGIGAMSIAECPLVGVVFKYDPPARKYIPDRGALSHLLDGISEDAIEIDSAEQPSQSEKGSYLAERLDIFLRYIYGGQEREGWSYFDKSYDLQDKTEIEGKIRVTLEQEPVYRFLFGKKSRTGS